MTEISYIEQIQEAVLRGKCGLPGYTSAESRKERDFLIQAVRGSRRYYLGDEVTETAAALCGMHPELVTEILRRARTPFDRILFEYNPSVQLRAVGQEPAWNAPDKTAMLVERVTPTRYTAVGLGVFNGTAFVNPVSVFYDLEEPIGGTPDSEILVNCMMQFMQKRGVKVVTPDGSVDLAAGQRFSFTDDSAKKLLESCLIGSPNRKFFQKEIDEEERATLDEHYAKLSSHARHELTRCNAWAFRRLLKENKRTFGDIIGENCIEYSGTWRLIISALYLINGQDFVSDTPHRTGIGSRSIGGGKVAPYLEHRRVSLKVPRIQAHRIVANRLAEAIPRRRHEVGGHWRHRRGVGKEVGCQHAFVNVTDSRQRCVLCDYDRWWVNDFERGDASIGYVTKDRVVKLR